MHIHLFDRLQQRHRDHHHHHAAHRGRGHHRGFFGFGGHFGDDFPGGEHGGFGPARKLSSADLQLLLLALLADKPSHGYELIKALEERSNGYYAPSPGMVYPALTYLEEIGHAEVEPEGAKKLYRLTKAGRAHLDANRPAVDTLLDQLAWIGRRMDHLRRAMAGSGEDEALGAAVRDARHALKAALRAKADADESEQRRIAEILRRAAAEIRGRGGRSA